MGKKSFRLGERIITAQTSKIDGNIADKWLGGIKLKTLQCVTTFDTTSFHSIYDCKG